MKPLLALGNDCPMLTASFFALLIWWWQHFPKGFQTKPGTLRKIEVLGPPPCASGSLHLHRLTLWRVTVGFGNMDCFIWYLQQPLFRVSSLPVYSAWGYTLTEQTAFLKMLRCALSEAAEILCKGRELHLPSVTARLLMQQQQVPDSQELKDRPDCPMQSQSDGWR